MHSASVTFLSGYLEWNIVGKKLEPVINQRTTDVHRPFGMHKCIPYEYPVNASIAEQPISNFFVPLLIYSASIWSERPFTVMEEYPWKIHRSLNYSLPGIRRQLPWRNPCSGLSSESEPEFQREHGHSPLCLLGRMAD